MRMAARIVIGIVAVQHLLILVMEMFLWNSVGARIFDLSEAFAASTTAMAMNQGLYNGFLAAGLIWALLARNEDLARGLGLFFLGCVVVAGVFGGLTVKWSIALTQGLPALIGYGLLLLARRPAPG